MNNNTNSTGSDSQQTGSVALKDFVIRISDKTHIKVSTLVAIILACVSATWGISEYASHQTERAFQSEKERMYREIRTKTNKLEDAQTDFDVLEDKYNILVKDYTELQKLSKVPIILSPVSGKRITGRYVSFRWKYDINPGFQNFILELKHIDKNSKQTLTRRYQIPEPERKIMHFEFPAKVSGEFFWRIGTGEILAKNSYASSSNSSSSPKPNSLVKGLIKDMLDITDTTSTPQETRLWSRYGHFEVYPSMMDKLKTTQELTVGMTAAFLSYDHPVNCDGRPDTFDMDFIEWVIFRLGNELGRPIKIVRKIIPWDNLLKSVSAGDVDIAIANITKSTAREEKYVNISFTDGYRYSYQNIIFLTTKYKHLVNEKLNESSLKSYLKGADLGVQTNTTNSRAAEYLRKKFGFKINSSFKSYVDVIDAIRRGKIQFGMLDSIRMQTVNYPEIGVIQFKDDFKFSKFLNEFNEKELGYPGPEQYAIAVFTGGMKTEFLKRLNTIINSPQGKKKRNELNLKHKYNSNKQVLKGFGCS